MKRNNEHNVGTTSCRKSNQNQLNIYYYPTNAAIWRSPPLFNGTLATLSSSWTTTEDTRSSMVTLKFILAERFERKKKATGWQCDPENDEHFKKTHKVAISLPHPSPRIPFPLSTPHSPTPSASIPSTHPRVGAAQPTHPIPPHSSPHPYPTQKRLAMNFNGGERFIDLKQKFYVSVGCFRAVGETRAKR